MSLGALSPEAHEALAIAMNRLGARSNSGEGGEDPARYRHREELARSSRWPRAASASRRSTSSMPRCCRSRSRRARSRARAGSCPGHKVNEMIARLRFARPGVGLISPPPHHDIYSIEDLAQLIFDLKQVNPSALVSVKLVARAGRRHRGGRRREGVRGPHHDLRLRRRHRREPAVVDQVRRHAVGARAGGDAPDPAPQRPAPSRAPADRRRAQDRTRRHQGGDHRRGELRVRHRADGGARAASTCASAISTTARPASRRSTTCCARSTSSACRRW